MATRLTLVNSNTNTCWRLDRRGSFMLRDAGGKPIDLPGRKARAIVAYLGTHPGEHIARDRLVELLWADRGEAQARGSLRQALLEIRRAAPGLICSDHGHVWIECARLQDGHWDRCSMDEQLFDDLNDITSEFDDWLRCERAGEAAQLWSELQREVEAKLASGEGAAALPLIDRMRTLDPYNEDWLRLAMRAESQAGHPAAIQQRFREMEEVLKRELGVPLSPQTRTLHDELMAELSAPAIALTGGLDESDAAVLPRQAARSSIWKRPVTLLTAAAALMGAFGVSQSTQSGLAAEPTIAVLPFTAAAGFDSVLAEGLSDEVRSLLARHQGVRVIGRMSSAQFKGDSADLRAAGRSLRTDYLVEGKVSEVAGGTRVLVSLVRARDGSIVWAKPFTSRGHLQPLSAAVGSEIGRSLDLGGVTSAPASGSAEAYTLYIIAKSHIRKRDQQSMLLAIELLRQALRMDPYFAPAWAQLGGATLLLRQKEVTVDPGGTGPITLTSREAVQRALKLDPNLAEAHSMMGLVQHYSPSAQIHLRRALQLDPGDTQTLYWWSVALYNQGDFDASAEVLDRVVALEPIWELPVSEAIRMSIEQGDKAAAERYLQTLESGNPEAAPFAQFYAALADSDFSRGVQVAYKENGFDGWLAAPLIALGFQREAMLVGETDSVRRAILRGEPTAIPAIINHLEEEAAASRDRLFTYIIMPLARDHRWRELAAVYDAEPGIISLVKSTDPRVRDHRSQYGPHFVLALHKVGREREAARLALRTLDGANHMLRNEFVPPAFLFEIAAAEAILGRREQALAHLEQVFATGWRLDWFQFLRLRENPLFATLHDEPRFQRLAAIQDAHIAKERREVEALGIL